MLTDWTNYQFLLSLGDNKRQSQTRRKTGRKATGLRYQRLVAVAWIAIQIMEKFPMRRKSRKFLLIILSSALAMAITGPAQAKNSKADVFTFFNADGSPAAGNVVGEATLKRSKEGVNVTIHTTELGPGNAYTIWWIIFNNPDCPGPSQRNQRHRHPDC